MPAELAAALAAVGCAVRDAVLGVATSPVDAEVVRTAGGDEVFGIDARADTIVIEQFASRLASRWPGTLVMEGFAEPIAVGDPAGPWRYLVDPFDGTRPWLAGKRSAWVLLGAGRAAATLDDLEVGAAVEIPVGPGRPSLVAHAARGGSPSVALRPRSAATLDRAFVTVARFSPGSKARIGAFEDALLEGWETYEDPYLCSGGQLMGLATGQDAAVLDPRPLLDAGFCAHPYDLAALVVARAAGVIVEALDGGPLRAPLTVDADVAWAGYANEAIAAQIRPRIPAALTAANDPDSNWV